MERGYLHLHLESDSLKLIRMLNGDCDCPWKLVRELDKLQRFKGNFCSIKHCFREGNMVADILSKIGAENEMTMICEEVQVLPRLTRGHLQMDRLGLPQLRRIRR